MALFSIRFLHFCPGNFNNDLPTRRKFTLVGHPPISLLHKIFIKLWWNFVIIFDLPCLRNMVLDTNPTHGQSNSSLLRFPTSPHRPLTATPDTVKNQKLAPTTPSANQPQRRQRKSPQDHLSPASFRLSQKMTLKIHLYKAGSYLCLSKGQKR